MLLTEISWSLQLLEIILEAQKHHYTDFLSKEIRVIIGLMQVPIEHEGDLEIREDFLE